MIFGGLNTMWLIVLFDLPTKSKESRKRYSKFRKELLFNGFRMMQYSVYMRHCSSNDNALVHTDRIKKSLPKRGEIRIIKITDKQFGKILTFYGKNKRSTEAAPQQLQFF